MNAQELLLTALDQRYAQYRAERKRCKQEFSAESVHDLRVATRRLLALLDLWRAVAPRPGLKKLRQAFKAQLDGLDDLRDTQVLLDEIAATLATLPELAPWQKFLQKRAKRLLKAAARQVWEFKLGATHRRLAILRASLTESAGSTDLAASLLGAVDEAYATVNRRGAQVDSARPATIHRVRIAFKKFRYMVEIVAPLLPAFPEAQFKALHAYQTKMGAIQDVEVFLRTLAGFAAKHKTYNPQPVRHFYEQRHAELIAAYLETMSEPVTFWRATPEGPFPWEQNQ